MAKHVNLIVFLIITLLTGSMLHSNESKPHEYLKYVDEIVKDFAKDMKKKYNLHCYGDGGSMPNDVEEIEVCFISYTGLWPFAAQTDEGDGVILPLLNDL
jgi:hypothetical protein